MGLLVLSNWRRLSVTGLWELTLRYVQNGRMIKRRREKGEKKDVFGGGETVRLSETQPTVSPAHELNTQLPYVIIVLCK